MQTFTAFMSNLIATDDRATSGTWTFELNVKGLRHVAAVTGIEANHLGGRSFNLSLDDAARLLYAAENFDWNKYATTPGAYGRTPFVTPSDRAAVRALVSQLREWKA